MTRTGADETHQNLKTFQGVKCEYLVGCSIAHALVIGSYLSCDVTGRFWKTIEEKELKFSEIVPNVSWNYPRNCPEIVPKIVLKSSPKLSKKWFLKISTKLFSNCPWNCPRICLWNCPQNFPKMVLTLTTKLFWNCHVPEIVLEIVQTLSPNLSLKLFPNWPKRDPDIAYKNILKLSLKFLWKCHWNCRQYCRRNCSQNCTWNWQ